MSASDPKLTFIPERYCLAKFQVAADRAQLLLRPRQHDRVVDTYGVVWQSGKACGRLHAFGDQPRFETMLKLRSRLRMVC